MYSILYKLLRTEAQYCDENKSTCWDEHESWTGGENSNSMVELQLTDHSTHDSTGQTSLYIHGLTILKHIFLVLLLLLTSQAHICLIFVKNIWVNNNNNNLL
jgi:hypothetical protein